MANSSVYAKRKSLSVYTDATGIFKKIIKAKWIYISLVPTFFLLCMFSLYPAFDAIRKSFYYWKMSNLKNIRFIGFDNYIQLLSHSEFWHSFINLFMFVAWGFFTTFFILLPVTYLVYKLGDTVTGKWIQKAYVIPMMVPGMVLILFWRFFYDYNSGVLNTLLKSTGMKDYIHVWLGEKATALPSLLFQGFPWITGFGFLILLSAFQGIDPHLHESSKIDGAKALQIFLKIDIPLIIPQAKLLIILGIISGIQQYSQQFIMTGGGPDGATTVPGLVMYDTAFTFRNLGYGSTMGVVMFIMVLVFTIISNKYIQTRE